MQPPVAKTKYEEIGNEMLEYAFGYKKTDAFSLRRLDIEIDKIPDPAEKLELKAYSCAAKGNIDEALSLLERVASYFLSTQAAANLLALSHQEKRYLDAKKASVKYADRMPTSELIELAFAFSVLACNEQAITLLGNKLQNMLHGDDEGHMLRLMEEFHGVRDEAFAVCNVQSEDIDKLTDVGLSILSSNDVKFERHELRVVDNTLVFIMQVNGNDADKIVDMNMQAAFMLADSGCFDEKNVTVLYRDVMLGGDF